MDIKFFYGTWSTTKKWSGFNIELLPFSLTIYYLKWWFSIDWLNIRKRKVVKKYSYYWRWKLRKNENN